MYRRPCSRRPRKTGPAIRLVVLDVGGTIVQDRGDIPEALRSALGHHGVASTAAEIGRQRGASKREVVRYFVDRQKLPEGADREKLAATIYEEFRSNLISIYQSVPPIAGAEEAIRQLRRTDIRWPPAPGSIGRLRCRSSGVSAGNSTLPP